MSNYQFTITNAGITAANIASTTGPRINITTFKVGSALNYTPNVTDTDLHGTVLHTGNILDYRIDADNQVTYLMRMSAEVGTFNFGEVGLYTDTGVLFALTSLTDYQEKIVAGAGSAGNVITFEAKCVLSNLSAAIAFPITNVIYSKLPELADVAVLPLASDSDQSNAFSVQSGDEYANACIVLRNSSDQTWAFGTHTNLVVNSTVTSATTTSITAAAISTILSDEFAVRRYIIEIMDGALKSHCRYVTSSTSGVVNFDALSGTPVAAVAFRIWRSNVSSTGLTTLMPEAETVADAGSIGTSLKAAKADHVHPMPGLATQVNPGFLSNTDKTKLDGIASGATNLSLSSTTPAAETVGASGVVGVGTTAARSDHVHPIVGVATQGTDGFMSLADKTKLDGIATGATNLALSSAAAANLAATALAGVGTTASRFDHVHALPTAVSIGSVIGTPTGIAKGNGSGVFTSAAVSDVAALLTVNGLLKSNGSSTITAAVAATDYVSPSVATTFSAVQTFGGLRETRIVMAANNMDMNLGNYFTKTLVAGAVTITVSNVAPSGIVSSMILDLTNAGLATITWFGASVVKWAAGSPPTLTSSGRDVLGFFTHNGGSSWVGIVLGKDVK